MTRPHALGDHRPSPINAIAQLSWVNANPVWAVCAIVIDVLIIYGLLVYGLLVYGGRGSKA